MYVEEPSYERGGRKHSRDHKRSVHSTSHDDRRSNLEPSRYHSPYRRDLPSSESSSREWSRTDSSRAPASTMPSSLHTSRSSRRHPGSAESIRYRHGRGKLPREQEYYDEGEDEDEFDERYSGRRAPSSRRSHARRGASPPPAARRSKSAHSLAPSRSHPDLRSSRRALPESESEDDDEYDDDSESERSVEDDESDVTEDEEPIHDPKMPTIQEDEIRDGMRPRAGARSKSIPRRPVVAPEEFGGPVPVTNEPVDLPQETPASAEVDDRDAPDGEIPPVTAPPLSQAPLSVEEQHPVLDDHGIGHSKRSHKSRSREFAETREAKPRHSRRRSRHAAALDAEPEIDRHHRTHYSRDEDVEGEVRRRSQHSRHGHRPRPASPPPAAYHSYSPERNRLETPQKPRHRRMSMDDARPKRRHHSVVDEPIHATQPRRAYTSGPHMASSYSVSTSKRSSSFFGLGNMFGLSNHHQASLPRKPVKQVQCLVCMDDFPLNDIPRLKCGHHMCASCLRRSFELSLTDSSHMPPKCCGDEQIPLSLVENLFDIKFKRRWNRKLTEYTMKNPTYCPAKNCGTLLTPANITRRKDLKNKMGTCPKCHTEVCVTCKGKWHGRKRCRNDPDANNLLDKAKQEGWPMQRCHKCGRVVELSEGCNHMSCVCGAEFCMLCGTKWKKCDCPWFNFDEEDDGLDYLNIERPPRHGNPFAPVAGRVAPPRPGRPLVPPPPPAPLRPTRLPSGFGPPPTRPRSSHRAAPPADFESEVRPRRRRHHADGERPRRRRAVPEYDDEYEHVDDDMLDIVGVGNTAGHFLNDDYVRTAPPAGNAPPMMSHIPSLPRAATTGERGFNETPRHKLRRRTSSLERRLADRLGDSQLKYIPYKADSHTAPPAPLSHLGVPVSRRGGPASALGAGHAPPVAPAPPRIRHARRNRSLDEEGIYDEEAYPVPNRVSRRRGAPEPLAEGYFEEPLESQRRRSEPPKSSVMAGLSGDGRGMNRVFEWRTHVMPGVPDHESVAA